MEKLTTDRGFWYYLLFSLITFGLYNVYLIYAYARETNLACKEDGKNTRGLIGYILLSIVTFGIYGIIWNVQVIERRRFYLAMHGKPQGVDLTTYLLTLFLWSWLTLGIMSIVLMCKMMYQQNDVNRTYNEINNMSY